MATPFRIPVAMLAKVVGAFKSAGTGATADTDFNTSPLTATQIESPLWNLALLQNIIANVHGDLAEAIAACADANGIGNHPWRVHFADVSANVANAGALPTAGASGKTIIGALGEPWDAANTDQLMTKASLERISAFNNNPAPLYTNPVYNYRINGAKVFHTTANIVFDCCTHDRADTLSLITSNSNYGTGAASRTIPDTLTSALVAGGAVMAVMKDQLIPSAGVFGAYYKAVLDGIAAGGTRFPEIPVELARAA